MKFRTYKEECKKISTRVIVGMFSIILLFLMGCAKSNVAVSASKEVVMPEEERTSAETEPPAYEPFVIPNTSFKPSKWIDFEVNRDLMWHTVVGLQLPEYQDVTFWCTAGSIVAEYSEEKEEMILGMPILNVYLADLTGDDLPEFCATVKIGSGVIDTRVVVYDYAAKKSFDLEDRFYYDYSLFLENGNLMVSQSKYPLLENEVIATGQLAILNGELMPIGIDRTMPEQ